MSWIRIVSLGLLAGGAAALIAWLGEDGAGAQPRSRTDIPEAARPMSRLP